LDLSDLLGRGPGFEGLSPYVVQYILKCEKYISNYLTAGVLCSDFTSAINEAALATTGRKIIQKRLAIF
jgi:hypothetical protein